MRYIEYLRPSCPRFVSPLPFDVCTRRLKTKELLVTKVSLEAECPISREAAEGEEVKRNKIIRSKTCRLAHTFRRRSNLFSLFRTALVFGVVRPRCHAKAL